MHQLFVRVLALAIFSTLFLTTQLCAAVIDRSIYKSLSPDWGPNTPPIEIYIGIAGLPGPNSQYLMCGSLYSQYGGWRIFNADGTKWEGSCNLSIPSFQSPELPVTITNPSQTLYQMVNGTWTSMSTQQVAHGEFISLINDFEAWRHSAAISVGVHLPPAVPASVDAFLSGWTINTYLNAPAGFSATAPQPWVNGSGNGYGVTYINESTPISGDLWQYSNDTTTDYFGANYSSSHTTYPRMSYNGWIDVEFGASAATSPTYGSENWTVYHYGASHIGVALLQNFPSAPTAVDARFRELGSAFQSFRAVGHGQSMNYGHQPLRLYLQGWSKPDVDSIPVPVPCGQSTPYVKSGFYFLVGLASIGESNSKSHLSVHESLANCQFTLVYPEGFVSGQVDTSYTGDPANAVVIAPTCNYTVYPVTPVAELNTIAYSKNGVPVPALARTAIAKMFGYYAEYKQANPSGNFESFLIAGMPCTSEPPATNCGPTGCPEAGQVAGAASPASGAARTPEASGDGVVHPATGAVHVVENDLLGGGFGGWGHRRVWSNQVQSGDATVAPGWTVEQFPSLRTEHGVTVLRGAGSKAFAFDAAGKPLRHNSERLLAQPSGDWRFEDTAGNVSLFYGTGAGVDVSVRGKLKEFIATGGNTTTILYVGANPVRVERADVAAGVTQGWVYAYIVGGVNDGMLQSVRFEITKGGTTSVVRETVYDYYTGTVNEGGDVRQVARVTVRDAAAAVLDRALYRYIRVPAGPIRSVVRGRQYDRLAATVDPMLATDAQAEAFADLVFTYDSANRVATKQELGAGCTCSGSTGQGKFKYTYVTSTNAPTVHAWRTKTTMLLPDGTDADDTDNDRTITFSNAAGQPLLVIQREQATGREWRTAHRYDAFGRLILTAHPSAVTGYDEALAEPLGTNAANLVHLADGTGLIDIIEYGAAVPTTPATTATPGDVTGYVKRRAVRNGELGATVPVEDTTYIAHADAGGATIYMPAATTVYRNTDGTGAKVATYTYTWQGASNRPLSRATSHPAVLAAQNGSGVAVTETEVYDVFGYVRWRRDGDGFLHYTEHDLATGSVAKSITDVDTARSSDFTALPAGWATPAGAGLHLLTGYRLDLLGRTTRRIDPDGTASFTVYRDPQFEVRHYPAWNPATGWPTGPTVVSREDRLGNYRERLTMSVDPAGPVDDPTGTEGIANVQSLQREHLDNGGRVINSDTYVDLAGLTYSTAAALGTVNTHFYRSASFYDKRGRQAREQDAQGTISRLEYDGQDRLISRWTGTNDAPPTGFWSPTNNGAPSNMVKVLENQYDLGVVGDGVLTSSVAWADSAVSYTTAHRYDFRLRLINSRGPDNVATRRSYDNEGCVTLVETYADTNLDFAIAASELRGKSEMECDERGRVWRQAVYEVDPVSGVVADKLQTSRWFDGRGHEVKSRSANQLLRKQRFDGAGRMVRAYLSVDDAESSYADAFGVTGDKVVEQANRIYNWTSDLVAATTIKRNDGDTTTLGDLPVAGSLIDVQVHWYDRAHRPIASASYGRDNGATRYVWSAGGALIDGDSDGLPDEAEGAPRAPNGSDDWLATAIAYDAGGRQHQVTDNLGRIAETRFDASGKVKATIENRIDGVPTESEPASDRLTEYLYNPGWQLATLRAHNAKGPGLGVQVQDTRYLYASPFSKAWPTSTIYPDAPTVPGSDLVLCVYDRLGRKTSCTDQRGVVRAITYDTAGRLAADAVTTLPAGVIGTVRRIAYAYDSLSRLAGTASYNAASAGTVVNDVKITYDGWGNANKTQQNNVGLVATGSPAVQFAYADGAVGGLAKYVRPSTITYPNGRIIYDLYPAAGSIGDRLDRIESVAENSTGTIIDARYAYAGAASIVRIEHPAVTGGLTLDYGAAGTYGGFDRFGRIVDQRWRNAAATSDHDRVQYGYDRAGRKLWADRVWTGAPTNRDEQFAYDALDRLARFDRGTLAGGVIADAATSFNQRWQHADNLSAFMDSLGNWSTAQSDVTGGANSWVAQTRAHNKANEIDVDDLHGNVAGAAIASTDAPTNWFDPTYDAAGNLLTGPKPGAETTKQSYAWDAWNRLAQVKNAGGSVVATYAYDGLGRRVRQQDGGDTIDVYYDLSWREMETRKGTTVRQQHVWDLRYIDAPILRWRETAAAGVLDEKLFYTQDANFNVTALVNPAGAVVERFIFEPYGKRTIFAADGVTVRATSTYAVNYGFTGRYHDSESGLVYFRNRYWETGLGRFINRDPAGYIDGMSLYGGYFVPLGTDPMGLFSWAECLKQSYGNSVSNFVEDTARDLYDHFTSPKTWLSGLGGPAALAYQTLNATVGTAKDLMASDDIEDAMRVLYPREMARWDAATCDEEKCAVVTQIIGKTGLQFLGAKGLFGKLRAAKSGGRTFTSSDPLVGDLANKIEAAYPGHVVGVNVPVLNAAGQLVTDADILLQNAVIQVKSGGGKGLTSQVLRTQEATGLPTIGYGPTLKPSVVSGTNRAGGLATTDEGLLIDVVRP
ncbi:MAG: RHS repeat-associated core domain-containing protein [Planctomycetes bacterium]|nr:RHS repeat-associated core domain-containing protein [Planctomycetota bacterium]